MAMMASCARPTCSLISRATWCLSITVSLWRLYSLSATVMPDRLSTAWYTMEMLPLYMSARRSKSLTHHLERLRAAGQWLATANVTLQGGGTWQAHLGVSHACVTDAVPLQHLQCTQCAWVL
jgi:hypothetical protein